MSQKHEYFIGKINKKLLQQFLIVVEKKDFLENAWFFKHFCKQVTDLPEEEIH
jgi:hypothetical protein